MKPLVLRYPLVSTTLAVAAVTAALALSPASWLAIWVASAWAIGIAARSAVSMVRSLRSGTWGIDVLAVAAIVSTVALADYWAALVVVLMLVSGEALEDFAARRARTELSALLERAPRVAHRGGLDVPVNEVRAGDELEVHPGEVVPVDSRIAGEGAWLDESSITGESLPVWRERGAEVLSGAVNGSTVVRLTATATAAESQYQTIIDLVSAAADSKAPFVRLADRVAIPFTLVAFVIGGLAWLFSGDPVRFAEVLVVATPCPLLIATPVAFIAGMSRAAATGVIIKNGGVLERLGRVRSAAFDKTGTLTRGAPEVDRVETVPGYEPDDVLALAAALGADSAHVLARAIVAAAENQALDIREASDVEETVAQGLRGRVGGTVISAGRLAYVDESARPAWGELAAGETAVNVGRDGTLIGRVVLRDEVRPEASATIDRLRSLGVTRTVMLTGDSAETAERIAELAGVDEAHAALLPADKVAAIRELSPRPVLMVGDGVNDAPVLAAADVGVAMGARGATAASESADVVVLVDDFGRVADAVQLSRRTLRIAYQSIGLGIGLSLVLMIVATFGVLPAIAGAALQEVVDVVSILNSLRAGRAHPGPSPLSSRR